MRWALLLFVPACNSLLGVHDFTPVDPVSDAAVDAAGDALAPAFDAPGSFCVGAPHGFGPFCVAAAPVASVIVPSGTYATEVCNGGQILAMSGSVNTCAIIGTTVTISALQVTGTLPLVVLASQRIVVDGLLDASSHGTQAGPGAQTACAGGAGGTHSQGSGGGGGGGFGTMGGAGGLAQAASGPGGPALAVAFRTGCSGGTGGGTIPARGGLGGGAIYLAAIDSIAISGRIAANGAGGAGASASSGGDGGAGGGSGGLIALDAPMISIGGGASVIANGGGGGGGGGLSGSGNDGSEPVGTQPGLGGNAPTEAGPGGNGYSQSGPAAMGINSAGPPGYGGGGGGGGAGHIIAFTDASVSLSSSPPVTFAPR